MSQKRKIALLSNITADMLGQKLTEEYEVYMPEGYDTWIQECISQQSELYKQSFDAVIVLLDGTESRKWSRNTADEQVNIWKQGVVALVSNIKNAPVFISTVDFRMNRIRSFSEHNHTTELNHAWYQFLQGITEKNENVYILDILDGIANVGRNHFYSDKMWYMSSMPYSREGIVEVVGEIRRALHSAFGERKKAIMLDLDNTLWGGVIGEDGVEGIELSNHKEGQRFYDFQKQLLEMRQRGVLLTINSKNNIEDAEEAIERHPAMLIRMKDIAARRVNWNDKAENLKEIAEEMNLTEGSFVFVDDNPIEREIICGECPDVLVPNFPEDTTKLVGFAEELWTDYFRPLRVLQEDAEKTEMYQQEAERKVVRLSSLNLEDYIRKLELSVDIHEMRPQETDRVVQLCNKTNQFNVTTKRYTRKDIEEIQKETDNSGILSNAIYTVSVRDRYGDSGLAGVLILKGVDERSAFIDTFLMSCRIMGRNIEVAVMDEICGHYKGMCGEITSDYVSTAKNASVKDLFERLGFDLVSQEVDRKHYRILLERYEKKNLDYFKEVRFEGQLS